MAKQIINGLENVIATCCGISQYAMWMEFILPYKFVCELDDSHLQYSKEINSHNCLVDASSKMEKTFSKTNEKYYFENEYTKSQTFNTRKVFQITYAHTNEIRAG